MGNYAALPDFDWQSVDAKGYSYHDAACLKARDSQEITSPGYLSQDSGNLANAGFAS